MFIDDSEKLFPRVCLSLIFICGVEIELEKEVKAKYFCIFRLAFLNLWFLFTLKEDSILICIL